MYTKANHTKHEIRWTAPQKRKHTHIKQNIKQGKEKSPLLCEKVE